MSICNHAVFESGITACAFNQAGACIPNFDDANLITSQLLAEDLIESPDLDPVDGKLPVIAAPGLGFTLNSDAVGRFAAAYRKLYQQ